VSATFEEWVRAVFDHPPAGPEWYWDAEFDSQWKALGLSDALTVNYLTRLFLSSQRLKQYSLEQVAQGIWFLIGEASPAQPSLILVKSEVMLAERIACVRAMTHFFRDFVAPAAPGPADADSDPFHIACYMWWDIFPSWGGAQAGEPEIHDACLNVMAEVLTLPSELCQLSALHGLNHWRMHHAEVVEKIVDAFLADAADITPRIREYASHARQGLCQ
jgi:hypothetical protein